MIDFCQLNDLIDKRNFNWTEKPTQIVSTRNEKHVFSIADTNGAYNQIPLEKPSQLLKTFVIAGEKYCF